MKKNLIVLLIIPFLIALLGVVTINTTFNIVDNDIIDIKWNYQDTEVFEKDQKILLTAEGINSKNYPAGKGNNLVWNIKGKEANDDTVYGEIIEENNNYYFLPQKAGECIITCSNEKGSVFKSMNVVIYEKGTSVITIQDKNKSSQSNIDPKIYYGEYDLNGQEKVSATIYIDIKQTPANPGSTIFVENSTNVSVDINTGKVTITGSGEASFTINGTGGELKSQPMTFKMNVVDEGVNVYTYEDLLNCTNKSKNGEVVVLRKSFESLEYVTEHPNDSTVLFGNHIGYQNVGNKKIAKFSFIDEVYKFDTTYNTNFIDQWNAYIESKNGSNTITKKILVGLHVQKNFYGNGYSINMHNLTFPADYREEGDYIIPTLTSVDLFRGPLPFYALGDHNNDPMIEAFGQDNIGMYVDGNNITINDLNLRNCDMGNIVSNLDTVGTVLETHGVNITILNSKLSNGKNVIRSFSSMNTLIKNCYISQSRNFLVSLGTNEYIPNATTKEYVFRDLDGNEVLSNINNYFKENNAGDIVLNAYATASFTNKDAMKNAFYPIQDALNNESVKDQFKGSMTIEDTYFTKSGIASIALESMFNGPFLESFAPSQISSIIKMLPLNDGTSLSNLDLTHIGGTSYPVELTLKGKTEFYDYKQASTMDISGLIKQFISDFAGSVPGSDYKGEITIDQIFPVKTYLKNEASSKGYLTKDDYINVPIAYYGGGLNMSIVNIDELECKEHVADILSIDFMEEYLNLGPGSSFPQQMKNMMQKAVVIVTGDEPFKFICMNGDGYLFEKDANINDLIENAKGA